MESLTYLKNIKLAPKKLRMYLNEIKKMSPSEALDFLMYAPHKPGATYYKALHSAINNATNTLKVSPDMLQFKLFTIEEGHAIKRYQPGARGTAKPVKRRYSHIKIILEEKKGEKKVNTPRVKSTDKVVKEPKAETKSVEKKAKDTKLEKKVPAKTKKVNKTE
jgi:large subunit ribosomal protein L22